jgi:hypothetical protein
MSDAVARDYVGRPTEDRRNELLARDYLGGTKAVVVDHSETGVSLDTSSMLGFVVSVGIVGSVSWLVYAEITNELAGETITFSQPDAVAATVPIVLVCLCGLVVAAALGAIPGIPQVPRMGVGR